MKSTTYSDPKRLADVMALIQVLAQAHNRAIRSESGLTEELQGKPISRGVPTWIKLAQSHHEFFRVHTDARDQTPRVTLIARHVLANDEVSGKRPALSAETTAKLLELAISLHDREVVRRQRFQYLFPIGGTILAAILAGMFLIMSTLIKIDAQITPIGLK